MILPGSHHDPASHRADLHLEGSAAVDLMLAPVRLLMLSTFTENMTFLLVLGPETRREFITSLCDICGGMYDLMTIFLVYLKF